MQNSGFLSSQNRSGQVEKERKKKLSFRSFLHDPEQKIPKKRAIKFKKFKSTIQASFQTKTSRDGPRKRGKKIIVPTVPTRLRMENSEKKRKKIKKIKKHHSGFISCQNKQGRVEKERKKKLSFRLFLPYSEQKTQKKRLKNSKN